MKHKLREYGKRYIPAEICALFGSLFFAGIAFYLTGSMVAAAFAGSIGDTIAYYIFIVARELHGNRKISFLKNMRNLFLEFAVAETLDTFVIRPFWLYTMPLLLGNFVVGMIAGKLAADIIFYIPTIISYEFRKKHFKD